MKTTSTATFSVLAAALVGGASAFAPSTSTSAVSTTTTTLYSELEGMIGADVETGGRIYDPWELNKWVPAEYARKAELSNGRAAMLATVGWVWPKYFGTFDSTDVTTTDPIDAILQADPQWWAQFIVLCGTIEAWKYNAELNGKSYTGESDEAAIDYLKVWDKLDDDGKMLMRRRELKNARLAMIGVASFLAGHFIPGSVPMLPPGF
eukprot:CAMPEP_0202451894 /NCGR_PEP_ID=MMETSP1360-20130828/10210_1 /ASSEMBLY_ACC=CAM_ASM_000848 /TAXON_ID=515479 /ORGANISM="Licmophora paradoxa, Strain CCMP2313" /LENGTH=206 /DNA_ID=CAMNT_0049070563 /DNA_START=42 /DNA_END=662 /DNA_ORIENTATION=-